mgnify:CR=1 FL=1
MANDKDPFAEFGGSETTTTEKDPFSEFGGKPVEQKTTATTEPSTSFASAVGMEQPKPFSILKAKKDSADVVKQNNDKVIEDLMRKDLTANPSDSYRNMYLGILEKRGYDKNKLESIANDVAGLSQAESDKRAKEVMDEFAPVSSSMGLDKAVVDYVSEQGQAIKQGATQAYEGAKNYVGGLGQAIGGANRLIYTPMDYRSSLNDIVTGLNETGTGGLNTVAGAAKTAFGVANLVVPQMIAFTAATKSVHALPNEVKSKITQILVPSSINLPPQKDEATGEVITPEQQQANQFDTVIDMPFAAASTIARGLGYNPEEGSGQMAALEIVDLIAGGYAFHKVAGGKGETKIKNKESLLSTIDRMKNGEATELELQDYADFTNSMKNITMEDIQHEATRQGKIEIADKIKEENKVPDDETHTNIVELKQAIDSPEIQKMDDSNPIKQKLMADHEQMVQGLADKNLQEVDNHAKEADINGKIADVESLMEGKPDVVKQSMQPVLDGFKEQLPKEELQPTPKAEEVQPVVQETASVQEVKTEPIVEQPKVVEPFVKGDKDYSKGKTSEDIAKEKQIEFSSPEEKQRHIAEESENPLELASEYLKIESELKKDKLGYKDQILDEANIKLREDEFDNYSDKNKRSNTVARKFIDNKTTVPLDAKLQELSDMYGVEFTPQDFVDYVDKLETDRFTPKDVPVKSKFKNRFYELTGQELEPRRARGILESEAKKINKDYEKFIEKEYGSYAEAEQGYYDAIKSGELNIEGGEVVSLPVSSKESKTGTESITPIEPPVTPPTETKVAPEGESKVSGIKKALAESEGIERPDWEKISDEDMLDMGEKLVKDGTIKPDRVIKDILSGEKVVLEPKEVTSLIYHKATLDKSLMDAYSERNKLIEKGESTKAIDEEIAKIDSDIYDYNVMSLITAQQQSLAFRLRKGLRDSNTFDVVQQIEQYKAKNEGVIPADVEARFKEVAKELSDLKQKINDLELEKENKAAQDAVNNISEELDREGKTIKKSYKTEAKTLADKFRKKYKSKDKKFTIKDDKGNDIEIEITKQGFGKDEIVELIAKAIESTGSIADAIVNVSESLKEKEWFKKLSKENQKSLKKQIVDSIHEEEGTLITMDNGKLNIPSKLIRDEVKSGKKEIVELTKSIHEKAKEDFPDVTEREVRDAITGYGKTVNKTRSEIAVDLLKAKRLGKLLSAKEDLEAGKIPVKVKANLVKKSDYEKQLKDDIKKLQDELGITDKKKEETSTTRVNTLIAKRQEQLRTGDFPAKKERSMNLEDTPLNKLKAKSEKLLDEVHEVQYRNELKNRTFPEALKDDTLKVIGGVLRLAVAGFDLGATGVQGAWRTLNHPIEAKNAFVRALKSFGSTAKADAFLHNIKSQEWYPMLKEAKVALLEDSFRTKVQEEQPAGNIIGMIWNLPANGVESIFGKTKGSELWKDANVYKASQRAYDAYVNYIRVQSFLKLAAKVEADGINLKTDKVRLRALGDYVNTQTGRASLGKYEASNELMAGLFFSLRRQVATIKMLSPAYYYKLPSYVRKQAIRESIISLSAITTASILAQGLTDSEDDWDEFFDTNSANFLSIKVKGEDGSFSTINLTGSIKSYVNVWSRLLSGKFTDSRTGEVTKLGERFGKPVNTKWDALGNYVQNKFAPGISILKKTLDQRKGAELDYSELAAESLLPMWTNDLADTYKNNPDLIASLMVALNVIGIGITQYKSKSTIKEDKAKREANKKAYNLAHPEEKRKKKLQKQQDLIDSRNE